MLSNNQTATILLISHTVSKQLKLDIEKYNKQYKPLKIVADRTYHDRYIIIDSNKVYSSCHLYASDHTDDLSGGSRCRRCLVIDKKPSTERI